MDVDQPDMFELVGLPREVSPVRLRYVYEQHVADAARQQNHRRLLQLSRAFDALPRTTRDEMYPKMSTRPLGIASRGSGVGAVAHPPKPPKRSTRRLARPATNVTRDHGGVCAGRGFNQRLTSRQIVGWLAIVFVLGAIQFVRGTRILGSHVSAGPPAVAAPFIPPQMVVDVPRIATDLDRNEDRDDISCRQPQPGWPTQLTCVASDGETWAVTVTAPPATYTAKITRRSTFAQAAYFDAWSTVQGIEECRTRTGALPLPIDVGIGHLRMSCGGGVMTHYLRPGNEIEYDRIAPARYRITVTASNGEQVTYDSKTRKFDPAH